MPSPVKPGRIRTRSRGRAFNLPFMLLCAVTAVCLFAGIFTFVRFWRDANPLDAWLGRDWEDDVRKEQQWLGAEAGVIDASWISATKRKDLDGVRGRKSRHSGSSFWGTLAGGASEREKTFVGGRFPCTRDDLVIALPTHNTTEPQIRAGRSSRMGVRTVVITNYNESATKKYPNMEDEIWTSYPDANPPRSFYAGDDRAALAPFIAFRALGDSFKWLLYGDDDTVFFVEAALKLASGLDPDLPYFMTDNMWWSEPFGGAWHPNPEAPRCLPCGYTQNATQALGIKLAVGCPCTPKLICSLPGGYKGTFGRSCGVPRVPSHAYSMHGGAGALISIGLLRRVDWGQMERCVNHQWSSGGDSYISICLWHQGYAHTTPDPLWHPAGLQMFDPSPTGLNPDDFITWKASHMLGNLLQEKAGVCRGLCLLEVENTVSTHLRARRTGGSDEGAAMFVRTFNRLYSRIVGNIPAAGAELWLLDTTGTLTAAVAARIDAQLEAAEQTVRNLFRLLGEPSDPTEEVGLAVTTEFGTLHVEDSVRSGLADSVASRLLSNVMEMAAPFAGELPPSAEALKAAGLPGGGLDDLISEMNKRAAGLTW